MTINSKAWLLRGGLWSGLFSYGAAIFPFFEEEGTRANQKRNRRQASFVYSAAKPVEKSLLYPAPISQPHRDSNIANTNRPTVTDGHPCYSMTSRAEYLDVQRKEITTIDANSPSIRLHRKSAIPVFDRRPGFEFILFRNETPQKSKRDQTKKWSSSSLLTKKILVEN